MTPDRVARVRKVKYLEHEIVIGDDETVEQVKANLSEMFPELAHATATEDEEGNIILTVNAGTKG